MKNIVKLVFGLFFSVGLLATANAQTDSAAPADDAIVCVQVDENVFDCYVQEDIGTGADEELYNEEGDIDPEARERDNNRKPDYNNDKELDQDDTESDNRNRRERIESEGEYEYDDSGLEDPRNPSTEGDDNEFNDNPTLDKDDNIHMHEDHTDHDEMYEYDNGEGSFNPEINTESRVYEIHALR